MTICPECGTDFETVGQKQELPLQQLDQECPDCGYEVTVGIVNYPDHTFEVVAPSLPEIDTECVVCGDPPTHRVQRVGENVKPVCIEHLRSYQQAVFDL